MPRDYHFLKSIGMCVVCAKNPADKDYTTCLVCRMDMRARGDTHKTESKYRHSQWLKKRRDLLYAFGVCVVCGKKDAEKGSSTCANCKFKICKRSEKQRRKNGIIARDGYTKSGICYFCESPSMAGKKTCQKHYDICCHNLQKARNAVREKNYFEFMNDYYWKGIKHKNDT